MLPKPVVDVEAQRFVNEAHLRQFREEGYFVLERAIPDASLSDLLALCQRHLDLQRADMERVGTERLGLTEKDKRYFLPVHYEGEDCLEEFLYSAQMTDIVRSLIGEDADVLFELFVVKCSLTGTTFSWHQDSGFMPECPHEPFISLWCALDDMTEENGTLYVLPYSRTGSREVVAHRKDRQTNDLIGYEGDDPGIPIIVPSGSIVVLDSALFHRSGANVSDTPRRAYLVAYSPVQIPDKDGKSAHHSTPYLRGGVKA